MLGLKGHLLQGEEMTPPGATTQPAQDQKDQSSQVSRLLKFQGLYRLQTQQDLHRQPPGPQAMTALWDKA